MPARIPLFRVHVPESLPAALAPILKSGQLAGGPTVSRFETTLAQWLDAREIVTTSDSSAAIAIALKLAGVGHGDEVILSPLTCTATAMPLAWGGARPVWTDVDDATGMPEARHIAPLVGPRTRAILIYHWAGDPAEMGAIVALAKDARIAIVEDASEALGARYDGRHVGMAGDFGIFSFYATKPLNTGEGGALRLEAGYAGRARALRRFGIDQTSFRLPDGDLNPESDIPEIGYNCQMGAMAAGMGLEQLPVLNALIQRHQENGRFFDQALRGVAGIRLQERPSHRQSAYWTYSLRVERRQDLMRKLAERGIGAQRLHVRVDRYSGFAAPSSPALPGVDVFDRENLSLPCGWWVSPADRDDIVRCLREGW